ncbi:uncharacterized protein [Linepithema humile]|uniref:uncharacterized protein n=1 Tax=Linepithema humile TaxID=83485 RepID=UPI00351E816B
MDKRREIVKSEKPTKCSDTSEARCDITEKIVQNCMLLSTTYGLNFSYTKKIHVGLQTSINSDEFDFQPFVKFSSKGADGICFNMAEWQKFQENMKQMSDYLNGNSITANSIIINKIIINFTTAYGARALLLTYRENGQEVQPLENTTTKEEIHAPKKRWTYSLAIAMQRASFLGLENILECVNANLNRLNIITTSANDCAKYLINEIQIRLPIVGYIENDIIKLAFKSNCREIQTNVRTQLKDLTFLDDQFEIVFLELIALYFDQIVHIIRFQRKL